MDKAADQPQEMSARYRVLIIHYNMAGPNLNEIILDLKSFSSSWQDHTRQTRQIHNWEDKITLSLCVCHCFTAFHFMVLKLAAGLYKVTHPICSILHTFYHFKIPIFLNVMMVIIIMFTAPYMLQMPHSMFICMQHENGSIFSKCWVGVLIFISSIWSPKYMPPFSRNRHEIPLYADRVIAVSVEGEKIKVFLLG